MALLLAEGVARLFLPEWRPNREERAKFWRYDPTLGWAHTPGQRGTFTHTDFEVEIAIGSHGLRDRELPLERGDRQRLLVLGDSQGWGYGVERSERFSELLEGAHPGWEILNASVSGYGTDQQLLYLRERGLDFGPDVVLLLFHPNDFRNNLAGEQYGYPKPYFELREGRLELRNTPVPPPTAGQALQRFLVGRTYLGMAVHMARPELLDRLAPSTDPAGEASPEPAGGDAREEITHRLLEAMNALSEEHGARLVVVSLPMSRRSRIALGRVCTEAGIAWLPLDRGFRGVSEETRFPHDPHWNPRGHALAAAEIGRFLVERGIFRATEAGP